jgi:glycosyltransferase involved in cell wall biosynthesis
VFQHTERIVHNPETALFFVPSLGGGGAERVMVTLANGFAERGYRVYLVALAEGVYRTGVSDKVTFVCLGSSRMLCAAVSLRRLLKKIRPRWALSTIFHANTALVLASCCLPGGRRTGKTPVDGIRVYLRDSVDLTAFLTNDRRHKPRVLRIKNRLILRAMRLLYPRAAGIVSPSAEMARRNAGVLGVPADRITVVPNPVVGEEIRTLMSQEPDHPWYASRSPVGTVILGVGRLCTQKDFPTLITAFDRIVRSGNPDFRLVVLGEGPERSSLEALVRSLGLEDRVSLPGFVENPFSYMARSDLFVLSSAWEGLPNTLIQALACGCPVVSTDCPTGPREILENGRLGPLVPVGDSSALAAAMVRVLENPGSRSERVESCNRYRVETVLDRYEALFHGQSDGM